MKKTLLLILLSSFCVLNLNAKKKKKGPLLGYKIEDVGKLSISGQAIQGIAYEFDTPVYDIEHDSISGISVFMMREMTTNFKRYKDKGYYLGGRLDPLSFLWKSDIIVSSRSDYLNIISPIHKIFLSHSYGGGANSLVCYSLET